MHWLSNDVHGSNCVHCFVHRIRVTAKHLRCVCTYSTWNVSTVQNTQNHAQKSDRTSQLLLSMASIPSSYNLVALALRQGAVVLRRTHIRRSLVPSPSSQPSHAPTRTQSIARTSVARSPPSRPLACTHGRSSHRMIHDSIAFLTVTTTTMQFRRDSPGTNRSSPRIAPSSIAHRVALWRGRSDRGGRLPHALTLRRCWLERC